MASFKSERKLARRKLLMTYDPAFSGTSNVSLFVPHPAQAAYLRAIEVADVRFTGYLNRAEAVRGNDAADALNYLIGYVPRS